MVLVFATYFFGVESEVKSILIAHYFVHAGAASMIVKVGRPRYLY